MKFKITVILFLIVSFSAKAQYNNSVIKADSVIDSLLLLHKEYNKRYPLIPGYRIQIFKESGNQALDEARIIMMEFDSIFPEIPTYLSFQEPYYRVRAGNFKTRLEALDYLEKIKRKKYRNVWIISDYVYYNDSIGQQNTINYEQENSSGD